MPVRKFELDEYVAVYESVQLKADKGNRYTVELGGIQSQLRITESGKAVTIQGKELVKWLSTDWMNPVIHVGKNYFRIHAISDSEFEIVQRQGIKFEIDAPMAIKGFRIVRRHHYYAR